MNSIPSHSKSLAFGRWLPIVLFALLLNHLYPGSKTPVRMDRYYKIFTIPWGFPQVLRRLLVFETPRLLRGTYFSRRFRQFGYLASNIICPGIDLETTISEDARVQHVTH
jgi:hypothetical protein